MENTTNMNKMDGVGESLLERMRRSREIRDATLIQSNAKPIKSILKKSNQSPIKEARKVSMNSSTMVWVVETDYASPSRMDAAGSINASAVESSQHKQSIPSPLVNDCNVGKKILNTGDTSIDASDSNSVAKQEAGPQVTTSFASVLKPNQNKVVQIMELRNDEQVEGAAVTLPLYSIEEVSSRFENTLYGYFVGKRLAFRLVENYVKNVWAKFGVKRVQLHGEFFLFQFETKEGMDRVLENGPWLIKMVPLILNVWSPDSDLFKAEIKKVPVWVKFHHVPIVAYSEVGLSLITTQVGKPIRLDAYTSNMCLHSWGRSAYARALIEVSAEDSPKEDLVIAIPRGKDKGHSLATIRIEYEWKPPRCPTCLIFDHTDDRCPKLPKVVATDIANDGIEVGSKINTTGLSPNDTADDGFEVVKKKKKRKQNKHQKQVDGVVLNKPSLQLHYHRVEKGNTSNNSDPKSNVASTSSVGGSMPSSTRDQLKSVPLVNSFSALNEDEDCDWKDPNSWQHSRSVLNESDSDVNEVITLDDRGSSLKTI
ncbi:probable methyltransferase PMT28 isoform X1 [Tanacetum coccineum]